MMGKIQYAGYLLIIMQGLILALLAVFFLNQQYMAVWRTYPNSETSMTVYLKMYLPKTSKIHKTIY